MHTYILTARSVLQAVLEMLRASISAELFAEEMLCRQLMSMRLPNSNRLSRCVVAPSPIHGLGNAVECSMELMCSLCVRARAKIERGKLMILSSTILWSIDDEESLLIHQNAWWCRRVCKT